MLRNNELHTLPMAFRALYQVMRELLVCCCGTIFFSTPNNNIYPLEDDTIPVSKRWANNKVVVKMKTVLPGSIIESAYLIQLYNRFSTSLNDCNLHLRHNIPKRIAYLMFSILSASLQLRPSWRDMTLPTPTRRTPIAAKWRNCSYSSRTGEAAVMLEVQTLKATSCARRLSIKPSRPH